MINKKLLELVDNKNHFTVDKCVLKCARQMKLDTDSLVLLIYLLNGEDNQLFDYKKILKELDFNEKELLNAISQLKEKKILSIVMEKNDGGILEERLNINSFYEILVSKLLDDDVSSDDENDLFGVFEKEFGRTLSPMEYDIINDWIESKISKDLILTALKEAVFNGVSNLRYVDKILYEWNKKGIKKVSDIEKKNKKQEDEKDGTYYEYDWLNE